jgi:hypothetical protein
MTRAFKQVKIEVQNGVNPSPDSTPNDTPFYTDMDKMRFDGGRLKKMGGWVAAALTGSSISGVPRRIFSYFYSGKFRYLIGTNSKLYEYSNGNNVNITPLKTTATETLAANPITTVNTSKVLTIASTVTRANGDRVKIGGATGPINNVPAAEINKEHIISGVVAATSFQITVTTAANANGSGGGAAVEVFDEIDDGFVDYAAGFGWGGGLWQPAGAGLLWGQPTAFTTAFRIPRIWSFARWGNDVVMTPGNGGKAYIYQNDNATAPTVITNSPTSNDTIVVFNNQVISLYGRRFKASEIGDETIWSPDVTNNAFEDDVESATDFIAAAVVRDGVLLLSQSQIWIARYVGRPDQWSFEVIENSDGVISPLSWAVIDGDAFIIGNKDWYIFDNATLRTLPSNTTKQYFYSNLGDQRYKTFCGITKQFNEMRVHYPTTTSEPTRYIAYNYAEGTFAIGSMERTAFEMPVQQTNNPLMVTSSGSLYSHESGVNDGSNAMTSYAETNFFMLGGGDNVARINSIAPDAVQVGTCDLTIYTKDRAQSSTVTTNGSYPIAATTEWVRMRARGRLWKVRWEQNALNEDFVLGAYHLGLQESSWR